MNLINHIKKGIVCLCLLTSFQAKSDTASAWFEAARFGDTWKLSSIGFSGFDLNARTPQGGTAMHMALVEPNITAVRWLITQPSVDINARNGGGETALMQALIHGHTDIVQLLLKNGAHVNQTGWTPLHYAAASDKPTAPGFVRMLLEDHAAYIDATSPNGTTPLMMAARYGLSPSVKILLDGGADISLRNQQGLTAYDFAQQGEHPDSQKLMQAAMADLARTLAIQSAPKAEPETVPAQTSPVRGSASAPVPFIIPKGQW
jgi:uncharacterized protein